MVEYIYNTIKATAGETIQITARITNDDGTIISSGCNLRIYQNDEELVRINGTLASDLWVFEVPAETNLKGKYQYSFFKDDRSLDFDNDIYFN